MNKEISDVFIIGKDLSKNSIAYLEGYNVSEMSDYYQLKARLVIAKSKHIIVIQYCVFLDNRHLNAFMHLLKEHQNIIPVFIVNNLNAEMKLRLKREKFWNVFWSTEAIELEKLTNKKSSHTNFEIREETRLDSIKDVLLGPSSLIDRNEIIDFKPFLGALSKNISSEGICLSTAEMAPYKVKDFVNLNYRKENGEYESIEGQVRWITRGKRKEEKVLGIKYLGRT